MEFFLHYGRIEISKCHRLPRVHGLRLSGKKVSSPSAWAAALGEEDVFPECTWKSKKKRIFKVASTSARAAALGEEGVFTECLGSGPRGRGCLPRVSRQRLSGKRMSSPSAWAAALREEGVFPECLGCGARGRGCLPRVLHLGKTFF
jgi:hypothetical protein